MKKLLSLALALIMVLSTMACLPFGAVAAGTNHVPQTLYAEDFTTLTDGTYTADRLAYFLGWTLVRGDKDATIATVEDGVLTIDTTASAVDYVFEIAKSARFMDNHTVEYDMTMVTSFTSADALRLQFAAIYTGSYDAENETTTAIIPKVTFEGYHNIAYTKDGAINEEPLGSDQFLIGGDSHSQALPEWIPFSGGYGKLNTKTTWKNVVSADYNQVDVYANGGRVNSTKAEKTYAQYQVADFLGDTAFLRVQAKRVASFDNISIVTGADVIRNDGKTVYEQNFDNITFDPETETAADLAKKIGWINMAVSNGSDPTVLVDEDQKPIVIPTTYKIVDGMLDILNPHGAPAVVPEIYIPEMETAEDQVIIEYDQMYVYEDILGEYDGGDQPITFTMYGRKSDFYLKWEHTQKGFNKFTFMNGSNHSLNKGSLVQIRPQNIAYSNCTASNSYVYTDQGGNHYNIYNSLDRVKIVVDKTDGVEIYFNGNLTWFLDAAQTQTFLDTSNSNGPEHMVGMLLQMSIPAGCHVKLDNMKVTVDPEEIPELLITEVATTVNGKDEFEYVEIYNNASERINVYEYVLVTQTIVDGIKSDVTQQAEIDAALAKNTPVYQPGVITMYPGAHTYQSVPDKKTGVSPYSITLENPAYEDGWLEPGEVAMIWNTANAMHSNSYTSPEANREEWSYTVDDFRTEVGLGEGVKVFKSYNDYNTTLENAGRYMVGIGRRSAYQPGYQAMYQRGDETIASVVSTYANTVSHVYMLIDGAFDPWANIKVSGEMNKNEEGVNAYPKSNNYCYYSNYSDLLDPKTGGPCTLLSAQFVYGMDHSAMGRCIDGDNVETVHDVTPGVVLDIQKRAFTFRVDDYDEETKYLGDTVDFSNYKEDGYKALFMVVNGTIIYENFTQVITENVTVERVGVKLLTEDGTVGADATVSWTTAVDQADFDRLLWYVEKYVIKQIEVGTLIAKTADLSETFTLTLENVGDDGKIVKLSETENWFGEVEYQYEGAIVVPIEESDEAYSAVGFVSITMLDGRTFTVYGNTASTSVSE